MEPLMLKNCCTCREDKPTADFGKNTSAADGLQKQCRECRSIKGKNSYRTNQFRRERNVELCRKRNIQIYWEDLSVEDALQKFENLKMKQNGKCAICPKQFTLRRDIHIDHCHKTGKVRGLLCPRCNWLLGLLEDTDSLFENISKYFKSQNETS